MLLSFAQFEREITGERIRDKVAASKRKGIWMGGAVPLGYLVETRRSRSSNQLAVCEGTRRPRGMCETRSSTTSVCRDCMVGDAGIELMAIAGWRPLKTRRRNPREVGTQAEIPGRQDKQLEIEATIT